GGTIPVAHALVVGACKSWQRSETEAATVPTIPAIRIPAASVSGADAGLAVSARAGADKWAWSTDTWAIISRHTISFGDPHIDVRRMARVGRLVVVESGAEPTTCDGQHPCAQRQGEQEPDRKSTRLNSSH